MIHVYAAKRGGSGDERSFQPMPNLKKALEHLEKTKHHLNQQYIEFCDSMGCEKCLGEKRGWAGLPGVELEIPVYYGKISTNGTPYAEETHCLVVEVNFVYAEWFKLAIEEGLNGNKLVKWLVDWKIRLTEGVIPYPGESYPCAIEPISGGDEWQPLKELFFSATPMIRELVLASIQNIKK